MNDTQHKRVYNNFYLITLFHIALKRIRHERKCHRYIFIKNKLWLNFSKKKREKTEKLSIVCLYRVDIVWCDCLNVHQTNHSLLTLTM